MSVNGLNVPTCFGIFNEESDIYIFFNNFLFVWNFSNIFLMDYNSVLYCYISSFTVTHYIITVTMSYCKTEMLQEY